MKQIKSAQVYNRRYLTYQQLSRRVFFVTAIFMIMYATPAQPNNLDGDWKGNIIMQDDSFSTVIELSIANNQLVAMVDKTKSNYWFKKARLVQQHHADSILLKWTFDCPVGVQSRVYKLSNITAKGATISFLQHTTFYGDKNKIKDEAVRMSGTGYLEKTPVDAIASSKNNY